MPTSALLIVSTLTALTHGYMYTYTYDELPLYSVPRAWVDAPHAMTRSPWVMTAEAYEAKIQTPAIEEGSVKASLSTDGATLNVNAKRSIEGCTCQESIVGQVKLPHTPRPEDVDLMHDPKTGVVSVKVARHAKSNEPTPLPVKTREPGLETRPLRWVPHESAMPPPGTKSAEAEEKKFVDKFRAVGTVVQAVNHLASDPPQAEHPSPRSTNEGVPETNAEAKKAEEKVNEPPMTP